MARIAEGKATAWLIEQGWRAYRCVSGPAPADLVISDEDGRMKMVDVKRRKFVGKNKQVARATISKEQRELGVEVLYVLHDNSVKWEADL
jgi:Holliday junction resolvase-like predicted endonuclease